MRYILILVLSLLVVSTNAQSTDKVEGEKIKMSKHNKINYIEIPAKNIEATKSFFIEVFDWSFVDYGPDYCSFTAQGVDGGFFKSDLVVSTKNGSPLIVLYSNSLETTQEKIEKAGGKIIKPIFSFPGGRRFHFGDPNGNEFAVWAE
ncbi:glyoxalase [Colwellia marinimaniae]|uniref:Glyoxalase n=2 Tax=Colwelliaceae TaxID=267889 RepID=A0ABQ0N033_9GAMM|nr:glyoxalase [Colwellia marinimaniae]